MTARARILPLLLAAAWLCSCCQKPGTGRPPAMVFAAASLTAAFRAMAAEFERQHPGSKLDLHCAGTSQLVRQVREGAAASVFASADLPSIEQLVAAAPTAALPPAPPRTFARNRLTIVTGNGNPKHILTLADLGRQDVKVALCGPQVPAGRYAREALAKAAVAVQSVSDEPDVKAVVSKVQLGEIDAGVVYVTDVAGAAPMVTAVTIPEQHNVVTACAIAVLSGGNSQATGAAFVAFVLSVDGQRILQSFGFEPP